MSRVRRLGAAPESSDPPALLRAGSFHRLLALGCFLFLPFVFGQQTASADGPISSPPLLRPYGTAGAPSPPAFPVAGTVGGDPVVMQAALDEQHRQQKAKADKRATPEAKADRERSRSAYRGLKDAEALQVMKAKGGDLLAASPEPALLSPVEQVSKVLGDHTAVVETVSGQRALVQSTTPLRTRAANGELELVNSSVREQADSFELANPRTLERIEASRRRHIVHISASV